MASPGWGKRGDRVAGVRYAANRAPVSHDMATKNVGEVLATTRGTLMGPPDGPVGIAAANIYQEPRRFREGSQGCVGINDPDEACDEDYQ